MGINQAIFTCSAKGISRGGGQGIYTYNRECSELELSEFEMSYCQYYYSGSLSEVPNLPTKYVYGKIQGGRYMAAEVTYLGKDYDKESGRTGNIISHMYSFENKDLFAYPMQLYGSHYFLTSIDDTDVDGTNEVDYLPEVSSIDVGDIVTIENVQDFLGNNRMEMFCHLVAAVLSRDNIHKVIIYDTHENIIHWLGAIELALPLQCAKEISFSSYEKDPMMSEFDIRGAVAGMSDGTCYDYAESGQFFVFDGIHMEYPEFDVSDDYYQFGIQMGMMLSYDDSFFKFSNLISSYSYHKADTDIYKGFKLYQILQGEIGRFSDVEFVEAVSFEGAYGNKNSYLKMLESLISGMERGSVLDEVLISNLQDVIVDFCGKELTESELNKIISLSLEMDQCIEKFNMDASCNDGMWNRIDEYMVKVQSEYLPYVFKVLAYKNAYRRLSGIQAFILKVTKKECIERYIVKFYTAYWNKAEEDIKYFDSVIEEAANVYMNMGDEAERYMKAMTMFLSVQEMGKGIIAGMGCQSLIHMIENGTKLTDKKQYQINKKKKEKDTFYMKQAKCAFEVFNYTQRNHIELPISRIRMQHLAKCIVKSYEEGISLEKSKILGIYSEYPIVVNNISEDELESYFEILVDITSAFETNREEYHLLFNFWKLDDEQKKIFVQLFADVEFDYFKKEKLYIGIDNILGAASDIADDGYDKAFKTYVSGLKPSFKEKVTETLKMKSEEDVLLYWDMISKEEAKGSKKGFFKFGRRTK